MRGHHIGIGERVGIALFQRAIAGTGDGFADVIGFHAGKQRTHQRAQRNTGCARCGDERGAFGVAIFLDLDAGFACDLFVGGGEARGAADDAGCGLQHRLIGIGIGQHAEGGVTRRGIHIEIEFRHIGDDVIEEIGGGDRSE